MIIRSAAADEPRWSGEDALTDDESLGEDFEQEASSLEFSPQVREQLLNHEAWDKVLSVYAGTVGLAVALTDCEGRQSGVCHNPQPAWAAARRAARTFVDNHDENVCPFCLHPAEPCHAVKTALSTGQVQLARDLGGMVHLAVPLSLGGYQLGALIAGQAFDQYPEPLRLQRLARHLEISSPDLWRGARLQQPIRSATLHVYGELLRSLGNAFLRQRYSTILDKKLDISNQRLRLLVDGGIGHALFTVDKVGSVTSWNAGSERMFGYAESDVLGQSYSRFFAPEEVQGGEPAKLLEAAQQQESVKDERWQIRKDGSRFFAEGSLTAIGHGDALEFGRLAVDVTERRNAEEALRHAQKLESIGVLASGIAHDFNNLLTGILAGISCAKASVPPDHVSVPWLSIAEESGERAADLANQLLAYGGKGKFLVTRFDLSEAIRSMVHLLETSIPKSVKFELNLESGLPWMEADASQIQQIVMNLVINGAESISPEGGTLRVSTGRAGSDIWMSVQDSGSGMSEATMARIFDPFFSTKFTGRGLGLAAVSGIVRGHHGTMQVESILGKGSTFRICFPSVEPTPEARPNPSAAAGKCSGTILVVDDEAGLCKLARGILENSAYDVLTAQDGREAVELFRRDPGAVTAVLLDMTMPGLTGAEVFRLIREIRPDVPIVVSTGYSETSARDLFSPGTVMGFVQKPYTAARLREKIRIAPPGKG